MRLYLYILLFVFPFTVKGQTEGNDLNTRTELPKNEIPASSPTDSVIKTDAFKGMYSPELNQDTKIDIAHSQNYYSLPSFTYSPDFYQTAGNTDIYQWRTGGLFATGEHQIMPGMMNIDNGTLGLYQNYGNLSFYGGAVVNKYGYFNGLTTQYGVNGNISYHFSGDNYLSLFGAYYFGGLPYMANGLPLPPSMLGYYSMSNFGGYFHYRLNGNLGVDVGGQMVKQVGSDHYRFEPIVTPYFKIGKVEIGLPVGQIMNGMIQSHIDRKHRR